MENHDDDDDEEAILEWVQCIMTMVLLMTDGVTVIDIKYGSTDGITVIDIINIKS
jgi:hypothetical protein